MAEFNPINVFSSTTDPEMMVKKLNLYFKSQQWRLLDKQGNELVISMVNLRASFQSGLQICMGKFYYSYL